MVRTIAEAIDRVTALGLPVALIKLLKGEKIREMGWYFNPPTTFVAPAPGKTHIPDDARRWWNPHAANYIPLWQDHGDDVIAFDEARNAYVRWYYEDPDDTILGRSYQQFLSTIFMELSGAGEDEELDNLAEIFGYKHLDKLRSFVGDPNNFTASCRAFVDSIG